MYPPLSRGAQPGESGGSNSARTGASRLDQLLENFDPRLGASLLVAAARTF
jgi:hypothetical protein